MKELFRRLLPVLAVVCLGPACADYELNRADQGATAPEADTEPPVNDYLRVDVYPSDQNVGLLPETHILDQEWVGLELEMSSPITVAGVVQGYDATPYFDIDVPGSTVPVEARIEIFRPGTIMTVSANSDPEADGAYELQLARASDYTVTVVPLEPSQLPFLVEHDVPFEEDVDDDIIEIDYGAPVYGWVVNESGLPLEELDIALWARDPETGTEGPAVQPDDDGYYQLRVAPSSTCQVVLAGAEGELVPTISQEVLVEDEQGASLDFSLGSLSSVQAGGQIRTADTSSAVSGVTVRFQSIGLEDHDDGELEVDAITNSQGRYSTALLPGRYLVEYVPPAKRELSPQQVLVEVYQASDGDDLDILLSGLTTVVSQILAPGGQPLADVTVVATERGFDGHTYTTTSNEDGYFSLDVPNVKVQVALTPPDGDVAVSFVEVPVEEFPPVIMLERGEAISGVITHDEEPVAFGLVEVRGSDDQLYATTFTDDMGSFEVRVHWEGTVADD